MTHPLTVSAPDGLPFIDIERDLDAPPSAVLDAHRDPELVRRWLGPHGYEMDIDAWDFATGGHYRYTHRDPDGNTYGFFGSFHSVSPEYVVQTFEFEGVPGVVAVEAMTLEPLDDGTRTRLHIHSAYPSVEARDGMVQSGMEGGLSDAYERLDGVLGEREG